MATPPYCKSGVKEEDLSHFKGLESLVDWKEIPYGAHCKGCYNFNYLPDFTGVLCKPLY